MDWKKFGKKLLFPSKTIRIVLIPIAAFFLIYSMMFLGTETIPAMIAYVLSAYVLTVWCFKIPDFIKAIKTFRDENKYIRKWREDVGLQMNVSLYGSLAWNTLYGLFQFGLSFYHHTFWFFSLGIYYICLAVMRFFLVLHVKRYAACEKMKEELIKYRACGWVFFVMNLALTLIVFFMLFWNRTFTHHMITAIAMAAYTFTSLATAIINVVKYKKIGSPIYSASKAISFAAACVSMLTLTSTLLTTFSDGTMDAIAQKILLGCVGVAVSCIIVAMAIYMIIQSTKKIKLLDAVQE